METKSIKTYTILGAIFTIFAGSGLHFLFEATGSWHPVALIAAVNESTWEHLKLAFWPIFFFSIFEYFMYAREVKNFFVAKASLMIVPSVTIIVFFYGYLIFMEDSFILDILIFIIAVILGYYINYRIMKSEKDFSKWNWLAYIVIIAVLIKFSLFTYFPPHIFLFQDPISGRYGI